MVRKLRNKLLSIRLNQSLQRDCVHFADGLAEIRNVFGQRRFWTSHCPCNIGQWCIPRFSLRLGSLRLVHANEACSRQVS